MKKNGLVHIKLKLRVARSDIARCRDYVMEHVERATFVPKGYRGGDYLSVDNMPFWSTDISRYPNVVWFFTFVGNEFANHVAQEAYWMVGGDLRALKRHYPKVYAACKERGLLLRKVGRKWEERRHA